MANIEDKIWRGENIGRGSFISSIGKVAIDTGLSIKSVRIALDKLKKTSEIEVKGANRWTMITICKYETYQICDDEQGQTNSTSKGKQRANKGQTKGKQRATTKEYKNIRIKEYKKNTRKSDLDFKNYNPEIIYPFENSEFFKTWDLWIDFRKEKKIPAYKKIGEQAALKHLAELAKNDHLEAMKIINQSIAQSWKGFFPIKLNGNGKPKVNRDQMWGEYVNGK